MNQQGYEIGSQSQSLQQGIEGMSDPLTSDEKTALKLLEAYSTQLLLLELIRRTEHNALPGDVVYNDLLKHQNLWQSCFSWMGIIPTPHWDKKGKMRMKMDDETTEVHVAEFQHFFTLIPLRDLQQDSTHLHADEIWILANGEDDKKLEELVKSEKWDADEVFWMPAKEGNMLLGGGITYGSDHKGTLPIAAGPDTERSSLLRVWWD